MKFKEIYYPTSKLWPKAIDISDGKYIEQTNGFYSENLSKAWDVAEESVTSEWQALMVWTIYQYLHSKAFKLFKQGGKELNVDEQLNELDVERNYLDSLHGEGYEHMLKQYLG